MSLTSALGAAVSGLRAQSAAIAAVSENIANSSTTAYKTRTMSFESLITSSQSGATGYSGGSVTFAASQDVDRQGIISATGKAENIAVQDKGFFVVTDNLNGSSNEFKYTRNGSFDTNAVGQLVNGEGFNLLGYRTNPDGSLVTTNRTSLTSLEPVDLSLISGSAAATTQITPRLNLPAEAAVADQFNVTFEVLDSLGVAYEIDAEFTKTAVNEWQLQLGTESPAGSGNFLARVQGSVPATFSGLIGTTGNSEHLVNMTFDGNGNIATTDWLGNGVGVDANVDIAIAGFASGAVDNSISLTLGTPGQKDGVAQVASTNSLGAPDIKITDIDSNGARFGELSGIEIDGDGLVTATFDNGLRETIYRIPLATFPNSEGLTHVGGAVYDENSNAGNVRLRLTREGDAGQIIAGALEGSAADTSEEFNKMIVSQQAYSAASQVVSTTDEMFSSLIQAVQ